MKLLRVGAPGAEVPPVPDGGYVARDVSGVAAYTAPEPPARLVTRRADVRHGAETRSYAVSIAGSILTST
jgi:hypothetical protein